MSWFRRLPVATAEPSHGRRPDLSYQNAAMQRNAGFRLLLQTETLLACLQFPALDKAGRPRRRRCRGGLIQCRKYLMEFGALRGNL